MGDITDFVNVSLPDHQRRNIIATGLITEAQINAMTLPRETQDLVNRALVEIYSTPEGKALIERAALRSPFGKVSMYDTFGVTSLSGISISRFSAGSFAYASYGVILLGVQTKGMRYVTEQGDLQDFSIQGALVHEFDHLASSKIEEIGSPADEAARIKFTNDFMEKYYDEPRRLDHLSNDFGGTWEWNFNGNFNPSGHFPQIG